MILAPDPQERALAQAIHYIEMAISELARWTPHGGDSTRVTDYYVSRSASKHLGRALAELQLNSSDNGLWPREFV